ERRARIRRQQLELRGRGSEVDRVRDGRGDRRPVVLWEPEYVERGRGNALPPAMIDHHPLLGLGDRTTPGALERLRRQRFHAETDGTKPRSIQGVEELGVETVEPRLALERELESARQDRLAQLQTPIAIL